MSRGVCGTARRGRLAELGGSSSLLVGRIGRPPNSVNIVDIVSETVRLRRTEKSYIGFCPFHANTHLRYQHHAHSALSLEGQFKALLPFFQREFMGDDALRGQTPIRYPLDDRGEAIGAEVNSQLFIFALCAV